MIRQGTRICSPYDTSCAREGDKIPTQIVRVQRNMGPEEVSMTSKKEMDIFSFIN